MIIQNKKKYDGRVLNLATGEFCYYSKDLDPKEAVIAAYAQDNGDWNTWLYPDKYGIKVRETELCYICGDFTTFKE